MITRPAANPANIAETNELFKILIDNGHQRLIDALYTEGIIKNGKIKLVTLARKLNITGKKLLEMLNECRELCDEEPMPNRHIGSYKPEYYQNRKLKLRCSTQNVNINNS